MADGGILAIVKAGALMESTGFSSLRRRYPIIAGAGLREEEKLVVGAAVDFPFLVRFFFSMCLHFSLLCSD